MQRNARCRISLWQAKAADSSPAIIASIKLNLIRMVCVGKLRIFSSGTACQISRRLRTSASVILSTTHRISWGSTRVHTELISKPLASEDGNGGSLRLPQERQHRGQTLSQ